MVQSGSTDTAGCNAHDLIDTWVQNPFPDHLSRPQLLDPELSVMYDTSNHPLLSEYSSETSGYTASSSATAVPSESNTFLSPEASTLPQYFVKPTMVADSHSKSATSKQSHSRKRSPGHIPRPRNAFILFRSHYVAAQLIPGKVENDHRHISKIIGEIWNNLPPPERLIWEQKADIEKEKHSRMYPGYRYKPVKLEGVVKRKVKCRGVPVTPPAYSSTPGIGSASGSRELVGSLNLDEGGQLCFVDDERARFINQEERRKDKARCARVAELVQQGVVGEQLTKEAQRLGLDRESVGAPTPQLKPSTNNPPGMRGHFHTNADVLRALGSNPPIFTNPFAPNNPEIPTQNDMLSPDLPANNATLTTNPSPAPTHTSLASAATECSNEGYGASESDKSSQEVIHCGRPSRRASSLPLVATLPTYEELSVTRSALPQPQQPGTAPASPMPFRPSTSSPLRRHRHLYHPYHRKGGAQTNQANNNLGLTPFNHVSYHSPTSSPSQYYYSPDSYPRLQLEHALEHPVAESSNSQSNATSRLYGINTGHSGQHHEPIDLSAMYDEQDITAGHGSTLHSTYATNAGKTFSSVPAAPAPVQAVHDSQAISLTSKPVHQQTSGPTLGTGPDRSPTYNYDWQPTYSSESGYAQANQYSPSISTITYGHGEIPHVYYANDTGESTY